VSEQRHVDPTVYVYIRNMDALGMEVARHHLRQSSNRELGGRERRRRWPRPHTRRCACNENRTAAAREHLWDYLSRPQKCTEGMEPPGLFEYFRRRFHQPAH